MASATAAVGSGGSKCGTDPLPEVPSAPAEYQQWCAEMRARAVAKDRAEKMIMMDPAEVDCILSYLHDDTVMFEFGSGGSTKFFARHVGKLYSAEHSAQWSEIVQQDIAAVGLQNVTLLTAEPNRAALDALGVTPVGIFDLPKVFDPDRAQNVTYGVNMDPKWQAATREQREAVFAGYLELIKHAGEKRFDVVLIDGRVRGECAIHTLPFLDDDSIVIIHDWFLEEWGYAFLDDGSQDLSKPVRLPPRHSLPSYRRALDYYDVVATVSPHKQPTRCTRAGLVVLRKKREHGGTGPSR